MGVIIYQRKLRWVSTNFIKLEQITLILRLFLRNKIIL